MVTAGLIEHLGYAERHWFQEIVTGSAEPLPWPDENTPLRTTRAARRGVRLLSGPVPALRRRPRRSASTAPRLVLPG
jgi:hypothetical protein